ncbi:MAG: prolipoprotein diacylglyceryl transferase [Lachnospiraceae bacterium]|nr:prolipoprotein diacylglyceryl transferase [Lachnospiraceae bacterium]
MNEIMGLNDIAFPNLGIYLSNVPKGFSVFGFFIAFYGVFIGIGVLAGIALAARVAKWSKITPDTVWDFAFLAVLISIICARIYYVIFMWDLYKDDLLSIFNLRQGGLAIYGGVIGAFIMVFSYAAVKKISPGVLGDVCTPGLILGQIIGRWGNFTNREVFGEYTDNLFAMRLPEDAVRSGDISASIREHMIAGTNYIQVHPTFLYEGLWNLGVLILMLVLWRKKKFEGQISLLYIGGYGLGRAWIEAIRTDTLFIPGTSVPVSLAFAIACVIFALSLNFFMLSKNKKIRKEPDNTQEEN